MTQSTDNHKDKSSDSKSDRRSSFIKSISPVFTPLTTILPMVFTPIAMVFNQIIPVFEPLIEIDQKLVHNEKTKEHAVIRHFSEAQIGLGLLLIPLGIILQSALRTNFLYVISVLGIVLFVTAYEIEEIYVTSHRILIRRIGMVERIIRVPSDEEHSIDHLVSFNVGRAPANILLVMISFIFYLILLFEQIPEFVQFLVVIPATVILFFGLRIRKRAVTLHLAGGLNILLGIRKGVPKRIVAAIQDAMYHQFGDLGDNSQDDSGNDYDEETTDVDVDSKLSDQSDASNDVDNDT